MPITYSPARTSVRQREDGRYEISTKSQAGSFVPPAGRPHCEHDGHDSAEEATACWQAFLAAQDAVYEI